MKKISELICKYRVLILIVAIVLLIPSIIGYKATRVNYDILVYLPDSIKTVQGQNILSEDFNTGAYSIVVLDNMPTKDILNLESEIKEKIESVDLCASVANVTGDKIPIEMIPDEIKDKIYKDGSTLMFVTFKDKISSDETLQAVEELRNIADERCKVSGMSATLLDTRDLSDSEVAIYVIIAVVLCLIILQLALDSWVAPLLLLLNIGFAVLYNLGSNIFLGEISYITKAISAVLQLGVTMDFAIFLYHSYMAEKQNTSDINEAMAIAIRKTATSVVGSSLTTIAGFLALCSMDLTLGKDIGVVMAKGVLFGLICVVTILPALILVFNKPIEKTKHKEILPKFKHVSDFVINHYKILLVAFIIILLFAYYGYKNTEVYYKLDSSLPESLPSISANNTVKDKFGMVSTELLLVDSNLSDEKVNEMLDKIDNLDGIDWTLSLAQITKSGMPETMLPDEVVKKVKNDEYQLVIISSKYEMATNELNEQIEQINNILSEYDGKAILAGEGPLMNDLVEVSDHDFNSVNTVSIAVIFVIMMLVLKSVSLPVILICIIEFAIFINMGIPYYTNTTLPFVASIVIGTIQLGATIDYAILITTKYIDLRKQGKQKHEAIEYAVGTSVNSIFVSGLCFFGATFGVGVYSNIEMIGSLCTLMGRGAIVSTITVVLMLPAFLMVFDKLICKTTLGMRDVNN